MDVPLYRGQPGTLVAGGAMPPPQSRNSQSSPVPGTYQATLAPAGEDTSVEVQPVRSVLARARLASAAGRTMAVSFDRHASAKSSAVLMALETVPAEGLPVHAVRSA